MAGNVLKHMPYVIVYIDDIIVRPACMIDNITLQIEAYLQIREIGMMIKLSKYEFGEVEIEVHECTIGKYEFRVDHGKMSCIAKMKLVKSKEDLRSFLISYSFIRIILLDSLLLLQLCSLL